jgi:hypothetical protein
VGYKIHGMTLTNPLDKAIDLTSRAVIARACDVSATAVWKWQRAGRLPATDHAGSTSHAKSIARAVKGAVTARELLEWSRTGWTS